MNEVTLGMIFVWAVANIAIFAGYFWKYAHSAETYYVYHMLGPSIAFSRASAACLNLNVAFVLLPISRHFATMLRNLLMFCCVRWNRQWRHALNSQILIHRVIAYVIIFFTIIHVCGHVFNIHHFITAYESSDNATSRLAFYKKGSNYLNPIPNKTPYWMVYLTFIPGITGLVMVFSLLVMFITYTEPIRSRWYQLFWSCHHIFMVPFIVAFLVHGFGGVVRVLMNREGVDEHHDPQNCIKKMESWGMMTECPWPEFGPIPASSWKWVIGPLILFFLDKTYRMLVSLNPATLHKVVLHQSSVVELRFSHQFPFNIEPGQYVRVNFPKLAWWEWHPFTLTSIPGDSAHSVHIRAIGGWTKNLRKFFEENRRLTETTEVATVEIVEDENKAADLAKIPLYIDGPYGAPMQDWCLYNVTVFIGAGIGVTPFASILKHVLKLKKNEEGHELGFHLKKVYFFWICPQMKSFEWFNEMLKEMERADEVNFFSCHVFLSKGWNKRPSRTRSFIMKNVTSEEDPVTGLERMRTNFGRPRWDIELGRIAEEHPMSAIGVFHCGPPIMAQTIQRECQIINRKSKSTLTFMAESFN